MFGQALGTGLGEGINNLLQMKLKQLSERQREDKTEKGLGALLQNPEEANALAGLDPALLRSIIGTKHKAQPFQSLIKKDIAKSVVKGRLDLGGAAGMSKKVKSLYLSNKKVPENMMRKLSGFSKQEKDAVLGKTLTPEIADFFLSKSNQSAKKARALARKYGYKV